MTRATDEQHDGVRRDQEIVVRLPAELPKLTPAAARILLKILVDVHRRDKLRESPR